MPGGCPLPNYSSVIRWTVQDVINWLGQKYDVKGGNNKHPIEGASQESRNWAQSAKNKLKESIPNFRLAGVDGNKLLNCTDTDLSGISCPEKEIRIIMNFIKQVDTPNRPFMNARYTKSDGYKRPPPPTQDDSGEESDGGGWGSDEFDDSEPDDYLEPEAPSRPPPVPPSQTGRIPPLQSKDKSKGRRRTPPPNPSTPEKYDVKGGNNQHPIEGAWQESCNQAQSAKHDQDDYMEPEVPQPPPPAQRRSPPKPVSHQQSEELYDDPDKTVKVQNVHGGPLPPLPGSTLSNKPSHKPSIKLSNQNKAQSQRGHILPPRSRVQEPDSSDTEEACYEDPDEGKLKVSKPPQAPASVPKRPGKLKQPPPTQQDDQEVYEEPDVPALPVNKSRDKKGKKPSPPPEPDQEVYEDPDVDQPESGLAPPVPRNVPKRPFSKQPAQQEPEDYEEPDVPPPPPSRPGPLSNVPRRPAGGKPAPTPQPDDQEVYEDPDVPPQASSIPQPPRNIPKRPPGKKTPASEPFQQDEYEVPDVEANDDENGEDYLDMSEGGNFPPVSDRLADDEDYLDMNDGGIVSPITRRLTPPSQKRKNENVGRVQPMKQTPKPQLKEEKTYEEPDAPPPRPAVTKVKDPPKKSPLGPVGVSYTEVQIKEDKGSTKPVLTVPPTATGNEVLDQQKWFYGDTNREVIRKRLEQQHVNGMYVIRNSTKSPTEPYTLQIFYDGKVYNLSIRRRPDNKYAIGAAKSDEKGFSTLLDLINFFKLNFLVLQGGSQTKLLRSLPKE